MSAYSFPYLDPHQSRTHAPTDWEVALAGAIENAFTRGAATLEALVAALNASRIRPREGGTWTEANLSATMRELGA